MAWKTKHGMFGTREYQCWAAMKKRCQNPNDQSYPLYGGRGITVCDAWQNFEGFFADMGRRPSASHSLERKDNDKGYSPDNCIWATRHQQGRNRRTCTFITFADRTMSIAAWCDLLGVPYNVVLTRIVKYGWSFVDAVTTPKRPTGRIVDKTCQRCDSSFRAGSSARFCSGCRKYRTWKHSLYVHE